VEIPQEILAEMNKYGSNMQVPQEFPQEFLSAFPQDTIKLVIRQKRKLSDFPAEIPQEFIYVSFPTYFVC